MNILQVIPSLGKGGAERMVLEISNRLKLDQGVNVLIVSLDSCDEYPELKNVAKQINCKAIVNPSIFKRPLVNIDEFENIVKSFKPDIIHSHLYEAEIVSRWKLFPGVKYITHCHDNIRQFRKFNFKMLFRKSYITDFYERNLMFNKYKECNNNFIAVSSDTKHYLESNLPKELQHITLMPNAIDLSKFCKRKEKIDSGMEKKPIKLINIGSFTDKKNQVFLIEVLKVLLDNGCRAQLTLLGDGVNRPIIEKKIIEYGLEKNVFCLGNVNNVELFMHDSDIYVHSATYEPFGLVLIEAMAVGLPVVCLDGKGNRDIIKEGSNGFMIKKPDANLFAEKIIELISDTDLYNTISENAVKFAADYDIVKYVDRLMVFYRKILSEKPLVKV